MDGIGCDRELCVRSRREKGEAGRARRGGGRGSGERLRLGAHLGLAAGLGAQPTRGAVELLGHHAQELCLVLAAVVVGGADVHQLEGWHTGRKDRAGCGRRAVGRPEADAGSCQDIRRRPDLAVLLRLMPGFPGGLSGSKVRLLPVLPRTPGMIPQSSPPTWPGRAWSPQEGGSISAAPLPTPTRKPGSGGRLLKAGGPEWAVCRRLPQMWLQQPWLNQADTTEPPKTFGSLLEADVGRSPSPQANDQWHPTCWLTL